MLRTLIRNLRSQDWIQTLIKNANIYIVGGSVRDAIMGQTPKDIDIVVEGISIDNVKELLKHYGKTSIVGQSFAVIKFRPNYHVGEDFDIAVPRVDRKIGTGHKGFEVYTDGISIEDDLRRRDFTINSIAVNVRNGEILDPFSGKKDIENKILRATDKSAFIEDPLRIIRAIQFASRFGFNIDPNTLNMMKRNARLINEISGERILGEFDKIILKNGLTGLALELIEKSDIDKALFGTKYKNIDFSVFNDLDMVSFYYILISLGDKEPSRFYRERLKGEVPVIKALDVLDKYFTRIDGNVPEEERKWNVFLMIKHSPLLIDTEILPAAATKIIQEMKDGKIPMKDGDIPVNGNDIIDIFDVEDIEVGNIKNFMYKQALMNRFNWKNREETIKYLNSL